MSLRQKTLHGLTWSFVSQFGKQGSQFLITAVLARLLSPNDIGLIGMTAVFTGFIAIFSDLGVGNALIQKQNADDRHLSSAFWLNLMIGAGLMALFILVSPLIAGFYHKPELAPILRALSVNFVFAALTGVQESILSREMNFKALMKRDIVATVIAGAVGIACAWQGLGVWSLVYQLITFTLLNGLLLWVLSPWKPALQFSWAAIRDLLGFSVPMTGFNVVNYVSRNIDYLLIGRVLGAELLGYYTLAYKLMMYPLQSVSWSMAKVLFPAFSKIQEDLDKVAVNYLKLVRTIATVTFPMMFGLFALAPEFIQVVYGAKWAPAVILIRIFCVSGLLQSVGTTVGIIYQSLGKTGLQFRMGIANTSMSAVAIAVGLRWGLVGVASCYTAYMVLWIHFSFYIVTRTLHLPYHRLYAQLVVPYLIGVVLLLVLWLSKPLFVTANVLTFLAQVGAGALVYVALLFLFRRLRYTPQSGLSVHLA